MFAKFDEIPAKTLQDIKETKVAGGIIMYFLLRKQNVTDGRTHRLHNMKTVYPSQFCQLFWNQIPSCICSMHLHCLGKVSNCSIKSCGRS